jgi:hypothetical protein
MAALLCLAGAGFAHASAISFDYQSGIADTMLGRYFPNRSYGNYAFMGVANGHEGSTIQSLLRFDNMFGDGKNQIPLGSTISKATLRLYFYNGQGKNERQLYRMASKWDDSSTWNSMGGGVTIGLQTEGSLDATYTDPANRGSFFGIDVTSSLQAWAKGASNLGWVIMGTGSDPRVPYSSYASSDNATSGFRPTLSVTYTSPSAATPEPGTLFLMGSAALLWVGKRRWRVWLRRRWRIRRRS